MRPVLLVIAGPNGSGKTTVTVRLREERWASQATSPQGTSWSTAERAA